MPLLKAQAGRVTAVLCSVSMEELMGVWTVVKTSLAGTCPGSCLLGIDNHTPNISLCL